MTKYNKKCCKKQKKCQKKCEKVCWVEICQPFCPLPPFPPIPPPPPISVTLNGAGSTLQQSFDRAVISLYQQAFPNANPVTYNSAGFQTGSSAGVNQLLQGVVSFAGSDIPPTQAQDAQAAALGNILLNYPIAFGAVAVGFNLPNGTIPPGGILRLSGQDLANIYLGIFTTWNQLAHDGRNSFLAGVTNTIIPVARSDGSGDTANFTEFLSETSTWPANLTGLGPFTFPNTNTEYAQGNTGVATIIVNTPYSIGYVSFGNAQSSSISVASIENSFGQFIAPTINSINAVANTLVAVPQNLRIDTINNKNTTATDGYPITTPTNIIVLQRQPNINYVESLRQFLSFMATQGKNIANNFSLGPIPESVINQFLANLSLISV